MLLSLICAEWDWMSLLFFIRWASLLSDGWLRVSHQIWSPLLTRVAAVVLPYILSLSHLVVCDFLHQLQDARSRTTGCSTGGAVI